jgi:hypothetical protein
LEEAASAVKFFSDSKTLASTFVFGPVGGLALSAAIVSLSGDLVANTRSIAAATANLSCWLVAFNASGNYEWVLGCHCLFVWSDGGCVCVENGKDVGGGGSLSLWSQIDPKLGGFHSLFK